MYKHILIATDGSELAQKGIDHGLSLAKSLGAKVTVITVTEPLPVLGAEGWAFSPTELDRYNDDRKRFAEELLEPIKASAAKLSVECDTLHILDSLPAEAILDTADKRACSLIVMASHGRRGFGRLILGSQTNEVVTRSRVPVLVVR